MNILLITETYPPEINGVARTLAQAADGLASLGHRITLVCPAHKDRNTENPAPRELAIHEVRGLPLPGYPGLQFGLPAQGLFNQLMVDGAIDVAYIATEGPLGRSARRACDRHGVPALSGLHTNFHQYSGHYGAGVLAPLLLRYLRSFHNRLAGTLVPTQTMARELGAIGFERLHVWPRGVHADQFSPAHRDPELRRSWGLGDHDLAVLYVGRLAPEKNIDRAFEAFATLHDKHPSARFVLVGDGPAEQRLREAHPEAVFAGARLGADLAAHYASGDLFLFPSQTETFGNVTLEAMASGLAVVAFDLAAAHELILNAHNGLLADPRNPSSFISQALTCAADPELRQKLSRHARETALQQDWPKLIQELEKRFLTIAREPGGGENESPAASTERP